MKRFFATFIIFIFLIPLFTHRVKAAFPDVTAESHAQAKDEAAVDANMEGSAVYMGKSMLFDMAVCDTLGIGEACTKDPVAAKDYFKKSALGYTVNAITAMYNTPPANLAFWMKDTGQNLGLIPKSTYAQNRGVGFNGLLPLLDLWKVFRNIAYMGLSIMMVFVGFMVMFRRKIDPKTVVTVQNALPRIIVALIVITFSYAIVGFLIEIMYIIMFASTSLMSVAVKGLSSNTITESYVVGTPGTLWNNLFGAIPNSIGFQEPQDLLGWIGLILGGELVQLIKSVLLWVIFAIALLFTFFRIFFMLISAYIGVLVSVVVGPVQILADIIPGTNALQNWLVGLVGNLSTFALTGILFMVNRVIMDQIGTANLWAAPYIGQMDPPLLKAFIGCGMMIMIPNLVNSLKQAIKANAVIPLSMGSALAPVTGTVGSAVGMASQFSMISHGPLGSMGKGIWNKVSGHSRG